MADGVMPHEANNLAIAYSVANSAGNATDGHSRRTAVACGSVTPMAENMTA